MKLSIDTKFHEYSLNGFRDVKHKSTSLMVLKNDRVDTIFKLKTSRGVILLKDVVMILVLCKFSDHVLIFYQVA